MDPSIKKIIQPFSNFIRKYHVTIVIAFIAILVASAIFRYYTIVITSTTNGVEGYSSEAKANDNFDQKTIERINSLKTTTDASEPLEFPSRPSPFVE